MTPARKRIAKRLFVKTLVDFSGIVIGVWLGAWAYSHNGLQGVVEVLGVMTLSTLVSTLFVYGRLVRNRDKGETIPGASRRQGDGRLHRPPRDEISGLSESGPCACWEPDKEPIPAPDQSAVDRALILSAAVRKPDDLDIDAIGGHAVWYHGPGGRVMVGLRNGGRTVVCVYDNEAVLPEVTGYADWKPALEAIRAAVLRIS